MHSTAARAIQDHPASQHASAWAMPAHPDILLATDGTPAAFAATRFVAALAQRWGVRPHVCTVLQPSVPIDPLLTALPSTFDVELAAEQEIARQLAASSPLAEDWTRETRVGSPADEITRVAQMRKAGLIVMGLRPHAFLDRMFRDETALTVIRRATTPVLAVTPLLRCLPKRIAVGIDFSRASIAAAHAALGLLDDGGELLLVSVEPSVDARAEESKAYGVIYAEGLTRAFARLRQELVSRANVTIDTIVLRGPVQGELLSLAIRADVDVLAVGSQRHSIARRAVVGGVTSALARAATRSLLVVPPDGPR